MFDNPYRSPDTESSVIETDWLRRRAESSFRLSTCILIAPALYNYWEFDLQAIATSGLSLAAATAYRTINLACFIVGGMLIWFLGVPLLETLSVLLFKPFANRVDRDAWQRVLYENLARTPPAAFAGACFWGIWVYGYYKMGWDFTMISWAVGIPSHILCACIYLPLVYGWFRLVASSAPRNAT